MDEHVVWVDFETMERFMVDVFKGVGVPEDDARVCADVLITADKRGIDSHGVGRLKTIYYDRIRAGIQSPVTDFEIVREGTTTAVIDGHNGMGHLIAKRAMDLAIRKAGRKKGNYRLSGCDLYVTLEPCPMCLGAAVQARLRRVVFGALDPKSGAVRSIMKFPFKKMNHRPELKGGLLAEECGRLMKAFFISQRNKRGQGERSKTSSN